MSASVRVVVMGLEFDAECEVEPFVPGHYSGAPENCYESHGGTVSVYKLTHNDIDCTFLLHGDDLQDAFDGAAYDALVAEANDSADDEWGCAA